MQVSDAIMCTTFDENIDGHTSIDIIHGKLDQRKKQLEVDCTIGRDIKPDDVRKIADTLQQWCDSCESVLSTIEIQIDRANAAKGTFVAHNEDVEQEVRSASYAYCMYSHDQPNQIVTLETGGQTENGFEGACGHHRRNGRRNGHGFQRFQFIEFQQYVDAVARCTQ